MKEEADSWRVGDVLITRIVDTELRAIPIEAMFADLPSERVRAVKWLQPHYATEEGALNVSFHAYLVESQGVRIIVDTCVGNHKPRQLPFFNQLTTPFLERLAGAGFAPEDIDFVLCTHLHIDHVGWNTRWNGNTWVPTFPNARYLFGRVEWDHWKHEIEHAKDPWEIETRTVLEDSVVPIIDAGLQQLIETDHRITDEVSLFPTPGHTPGHVSVAIASGGSQAFIAGDVMHHPIQIADAGIHSVFDTDGQHAEKTRREFIDTAAGRGILVLGTHFARPSGGWIVRDGDSWRFASSPDASTG